MGPESNDKCPCIRKGRGRFETEEKAHRGEGEVNMEEEIGVMWPEASEGPRMPAASGVGRSNE